MPHVWLAYVARMVGICRTYGWHMSHVWLAYVARVVGICRTYCPHMFHLPRKCMPSQLNGDNYMILKG